MPRIKHVYSKVYDVPRRPFEKERLDQVIFISFLAFIEFEILGAQNDRRIWPSEQA